MPLAEFLRLVAQSHITLIHGKSGKLLKGQWYFRFGGLVFGYFFWGGVAFMVREGHKQHRGDVCWTGLILCQVILSGLYDL